MSIILGSRRVLRRTQNPIASRSRLLRHYAVRVAQKKLEEFDEQARSALIDAIRNPPDLESKRRAEAILAKIRGPIEVPEILRSYRAIEVLESIGSAGALEVLRRLAQGASDARQTHEAQAALRRIAFQ